MPIKSKAHLEVVKDHDEKRGSDDPTKAAFAFLHGAALAEAGHEVQISLLGEAVSLMRKSVAESDKWGSSNSSQFSFWN
jgi:predicted peroxiredoxin